MRAILRETIEWDRALFLGEGDTPCPETIDVTGYARALVSGPMALLAAGAWRLTACFSLCAEAARHPYLLQFVFGSSLVELRFQPAGEGQYRLSLDNAFDKDAHATLRLWLVSPAFHGGLRFQGAWAEPLSPAPGACQELAA